MDIPKNYDPNNTEKNIYSVWEKEDVFNPDKNNCSLDSPYFSIVLPPPNVTGVLHLGHALGITTEDVLVRFHRMKGYRTLWIPGTDHAAIATQSKVEKILQKEEKKSRHDLKREDFLKHVHSFAEESKKTIIEQIKKLGASVDWSREAYTLDDKRNIAVVTAFKKLYDLGLIYRGIRIINWDPKGQTTVSDDELVYEETEGTLYTFYYDKTFPLPISTTRPETKLGDTAVAVNPNDKRYKKYIGKEFEVDFLGEKLFIKVVADNLIDPKFGTGVVGITPAHSHTDWDIAVSHNLKSKQVINEYGKIALESHSFSGMKIKEAREEIVKKLKENNLLLKEEKIKQNIARAERTNGIIEPLPKMQWFIAVNKEFPFPHKSFSFVKKGEKTTLKKLMQLSVKEKHIRIIPSHFEKTYFHWINNLRDWCISRQILFGHRIPVFYCNEEVYIGKKAPSDKKWLQDDDTLDTWFSSALWTFSTLGWPEETTDFKNYHPTTVLETGYDILFFWVARMILMTTVLIGDIPFQSVYLHGLVRDEKGKKMSKSLGNSIDPIDVAEKYGTDALRMSLIIGSAPGNDIKMSEDKIKAQKHFANKIWNAARFVLSSLPKNEEELQKIISNSVPLTKEDSLKEKNFKKHLKKVTKNIENYRLYLAAEEIYHYFWHTFADITIEESKTNISKGNAKERLSAIQLLYNQTKKQLKLLHPFMPFITEKIWSIFPKEEKNLLIVEKWPEE
jgi:valyl-tRNA synthetase